MPVTVAQSFKFSYDLEEYNESNMKLVYVQLTETIEITRELPQIFRSVVRGFVPKPFS